MKESVRSMAAYFILVGLVGIYANAMAIAKSPRDLVVLAIGSSFLTLGALYLLIGIRVRHMLVRQPGMIRGALIASVIVLALRLAAGLANADTAGIVGSLVGFLIVWYLLANTRRLSKEESAKAAEQVPATQPSDTSRPA